MKDLFSMELNYTIQIPAINESRALSFSIYYFEKMNVRPKYILDSKHSDEVRSILSASGYDPAVFMNDKPFIENGYEAFAAASPTDWILRLDCDEIPSRALIKACHDFVERDTHEVAGFERHQVMWRDDRLLSAQIERLSPKRCRHWRLFNRKRVTFDNRIHTPGFVLEDRVVLPPEACAYHLAWEFLTWEDRLNKARRYDSHGQDDYCRTNQLLPIEQAQMAPLEVPFLNNTYLSWRKNKTFEFVSI